MNIKKDVNELMISSSNSVVKEFYETAIDIINEEILKLDKKTTFAGFKLSDLGDEILKRLGKSKTDFTKGEKNYYHNYLQITARALVNNRIIEPVKIQEQRIGYSINFQKK